MIPQQLPTEVWSLILTHPVIIGSNGIANGQASCNVRRSARKTNFLSCSLTCKTFYAILKDPFFQAQWAINYHDGSVRDALFLIIARKWTLALDLFCRSQWIRKTRIVKNVRSNDESVDRGDWCKTMALNDALIYAMCNLSPKRPLILDIPSSLRSSRNTRNYSADASRSCAIDDILTCYSDDSHTSTVQNRLSRSDTDSGDRSNAILDIIRVYQDETAFIGDHVGRLRRYWHAQALRKAPSLKYVPEESGNEEDNNCPSAVEIVTILLKNGADPHFLDNFALRRAARNGSIDLMHLLLRQGASVTCKNNEAIKFAAQNGHLDVVQTLILHDASPLVALQSACSKGHDRIVHWILHATEDTSLKATRSLKSSLQAWREDYRNQCLQAPGLQSTQPRNGIHTAWELQNQALQHPLVIAARNHHPVALNHVLHFLYETPSKAKKTLLASYGGRYAINAAIRFAARGGYVASVRLLGQWGADVGLAIQAAAKFSQVTVVRLIIDEFRSELGLNSSASSMIGSPDHRIDARYYLLSAIRSTSDPDIVEMVMQEANLTWQEVTNLILTPSVSSSMTQTEMELNEINVAGPEPLQFREWATSTHLSVDRVLSDGARIHAYLRNLDRRADFGRRPADRMRWVHRR